MALPSLRTGPIHARSARATVGSAAVALVVLLTGCTGEQPRADPSSTPAAPTTTPAADAPAAVVPAGDPTVIAAGLASPWSIAFHGDAALVSERDSGRILEVSADGSTRELLTVADVVHGGEGGLLGLVVSGDALFAYSTGPDGNRIERYPLSGEAGDVRAGEAETILDGIPSGRTHNGGRLAIGPDGLLYASVGDAQDRGAPQNPESLGGKILRLTLDGDAPADNPIPGSLVYSLGHRNVQGIAWAEDGTMVASEFGQDTWDELNVITPGANYGWPVVEGVAGQAEFTDPVQQWTPDEASPSGVAVVGGSVFVANLRGALLRSIPLADTASSESFLTGDYGRLRDVMAAPDGSLWILTNNTDGRGDPREGDDRLLRLPLSPTP